MPTALTPDLEVPHSPAGQQVALVALGNPEVLAEVMEVLQSAGLAPVAASSAELALAEVRQKQPSLAVVDSAIIGTLTPELLRRIRMEPSVFSLPLILIAPEDRLDINRMVDLGIRDFVSPGSIRRDLGLRVALVLAAGRATRQRKLAAEMLREECRQISASIRATNEPHHMAEIVVRGLGATFAADHVRLVTFPDERVPELTRQWNRRPGTTSPELDIAEAERLAGRLWDHGRLLTVEDHGNEGPDNVPAAVSAAAAAAGVRTSVIVPLGHGDKAFGLIWISGRQHPHRWTSTEASLLQHLGGNLAHGLVQGHLITAQRDVLVRQRELDRAKTDFVATVNHELRTPLTSITGYLELILDGAGGEIPPEAAQMLEIVGRNAVRLNQLIEDLLTISRSDSSEVDLAVEEVDLEKLLATVTAALTPAARANNLDFRLTLGQAPLLVDGDRTQLEQVFTNLCSNAVKFTPSGGTVELSAEDRPLDGGPGICIRVRDTGIGIPQSDVPKLFRRFFRASNATAAAIPGTGLGLAIVQDIVLQHGGELSLDSAVGQGTTVAVHLPAHR